MVGFNPKSAFSTPQASRFFSPRKASSAEEDDVQQITATTEEPEESAESEPAAQPSKKRHAPLPQHFTPSVKPSGHNWLAYAGIGTVATGVGAIGAGAYKTSYLPHSKIELKEGWSKNTKTPKDVKANTAWLQDHHGNCFSSDLNPFEESPLAQGRNFSGLDLKYESGKNLKAVQLNKMSNEFKAYNYYEFCEGQEKSAADWCIAPSNPSGNSSPNKILMLSTGEDEPFGIIAELGEEAKITNNKVSTVTAIIPEKITDTWRSDLVGLWT